MCLTLAEADVQSGHVKSDVEVINHEKYVYKVEKELVLWLYLPHTLSRQYNCF